MISCLIIHFRNAFYIHSHPNGGDEIYSMMRCKNIRKNLRENI